MTKRLIKTRKDHAALRAVIEENTKPAGLTLTPPAGALTAGVVNVAHAGVTFASSDAVGPPAFSVASTGVLSGTPTVVANASFSIRVSDGVGNSKTQAYTLAVTAT